MEDFSNLTIVELREICRDYGFSLARDETWRKELMIGAINFRGSAALIEAMEAQSIKKRQMKAKSSKEKHDERVKRKVEGNFERRQRRRVEEHDNSHWQGARQADSFMELPSEEEARECYRRFYAGTSAVAVATSVCAVCGQEVGAFDFDGLGPTSGKGVNQSSLKRLSEIRNWKRLIPKQSHSDHKLFNGCLLEPAGVREVGNDPLINICRKCSSDLESTNKNDHPPKFSLANGMWIGPVPDVISDLTFPEQLLIALLFPRVYVFKLFPKAGGRLDNKSLQRGMKGTVSTFDLDIEGIVSMISGELLPHPPSVLATVISVTFIGLGELPRRWLRSTFTVRRDSVRKALEWLKSHNPHYANIKISSDQLEQLPENDVPVEILGIVRQTEDIGLIDQEGSGYVPTEMDEGAEDLDGIAGQEGDANVEVDDDVDEDDGSGKPDVVPLEISGVIDTDLSRLSANELMMWGLVNLWSEDKEGGYAVRHGSRPVRDFPQRRRNPNDGDEEENTNQNDDTYRNNYFERAYPFLFPFGTGGIEGDQIVKVDFIEHIRWALRYHDRRFRRHETFSFVAFGIYQRRQALSSARIQIRRQNFEQDARHIGSVTLESLERAQKEEDAGKTISDVGVKTLRKHVHATASRMVASDQCRYAKRSRMWSTTIIFGPPSLWITINPTDLHDPIAQVFAGENINMDELETAMGLDAEKRAQNIAQDPRAGAQFFHFLIRAIIRDVFGVDVTLYQVRRKMGVAGKVQAYFGMVESQGRGTLHLHLLVWLKGAPNATEMVEKLKSPSFREKIVKFIKENIRAYLPGLETAETIKTIPREKGIAFSRPPNPDSSNFSGLLQDFELRVVRTEQVHTCRVRRCLIPRNGVYVCKRNAPFERSEVDFVEENGKWGQKRLYEFLNGWMPALSTNGRCNNDIKLLTHGRDTRDVYFYVSGYAAKKQGRSHNVCAILAKGFAYHLERIGAPEARSSPVYIEGLRDKQRLMLFRLVNAINREQELAGPMVMSYLMGWGDSYESHQYSPIYWSSFMGKLLKVFPELRDYRRNMNDEPSTDEKGEEVNDPGSGEEQTRTGEEGEEDVMNRDADEAEKGNEVLTLDINTSGKVYAKCQITDYAMRGQELADLNMIEFFVNTYEEEITSRKRKAKGGTAESSESSDGHGDEEREDGSEARKGGGRQKHTRYGYLEGHPRGDSVRRVQRAPEHCHLPNFVGRYFPRRDDDNELYAASMLMLLKPWRNLQTDLKEHNATWKETLETFTATPGARSKNVEDIIENIQYYHASKEAATSSRTACESGNNNRRYPVGASMDSDEEEDMETLEAGQRRYIVTEDDVQKAVTSQTSLREAQHAELAIEVARQRRIFTAESRDWDITSSERATKGSKVAKKKLEKWREQMQTDGSRIVNGVAEDAGRGAAVTQLTGGTITQPQVSPRDGVETYSEAALTSVDPNSLKEDQRRAYDIVVWHLDQKLAQRNPPPLRMVIPGEGGTGKSKTVQTMTDAFAARGELKRLAKAAYTGIAASIINGKTTHVIGAIRVGKKEEEMTDEEKKRIQEMWTYHDYLFIDEGWMLSKTFLAHLSRNISIAKGASADTGASFGGVSIIFVGDPHQFPPVACPIREALYYPINAEKDSVESQLGRKIYEEFDTVVILKEQMRITDPVWHNFLQHLRYGKVDDEDIAMLKELVIGEGEGGVDFKEEPWKSASLITPRHAVRKRWNEMAVRKMCRDSGRQLFICKAEDTIKGRPLTTEEEFILESRPASKDGKRHKRTRDLPRTTEIALGMKVMVTSNIDTDLDIANGARGEIVGIVLHEDEPPVGDEAVVELKYLPAYILVKLNRTRASKLDGLDEGVIPIEPAMVNYRITSEVQGKQKTQNVKRRQFPMTAAYAFTDYRSQGQTLLYVLIDIASPPTGRLSLFNLYVALSRSSGRETIRLLRDFKDEIFKAKHDPELEKEDKRLEELDRRTKEWYNRVICRENAEA